LGGLSTFLRRRKSITYCAESITDPVDAEFMAPPPRAQAKALQAAE
jgi:hypothetical protein